jgi:predicted  nucleic acid-binding Zn-ribbon protein
MMSRKMEESLASGGITGVLTMSLLWAMRVYETRKAKANGGTVYDNVKNTGNRIAVVEEKINRMESDISEMRDKMARTHRDLCSFREDFHKYIAFQKGMEHAKRQGKD